LGIDRKLLEQVDDTGGGRRAGLVKDGNNVECLALFMG
jgi:hypothetical protein